MHLGIDFSTILVDFGTQVGTQNGPKIDPRRHLKQKQFWNAFWGRFGRGWGGDSTGGPAPRADPGTPEMTNFKETNTTTQKN